MDETLCVTIDMKDIEYYRYLFPVVLQMITRHLEMLLTIQRKLTKSKTFGGACLFLNFK